MTRRSEKEPDLPSFFQDNPWLDILAQREAEPAPDFVASRASSAPVVKGATPVIEPEPVASSPTATPPSASFPRELVVRLKVPSELLEAIRELKEAVIMALSVSQRQATSVPIYIPISVAQMAQAPQVSASPSKPVPPLSPTPCLQHFPPLVGPGREAEHLVLHIGFEAREPPPADGALVNHTYSLPKELKAFHHSRSEIGLFNTPHV